MKRIKYIFSMMCMVLALALTSCEVDNYAEADAILAGRVIDSTTGQPIVTEQPTGFQVYYAEIGYKEDAREQNIWGKADGTYRNARLFANTYRIQIRNGAFADTEEKTVEIKSGQETIVDFTVTPYLSLSNVSITKEGVDAVKVKFTVTKNVSTETLKDYRLFATYRTPAVGVNTLHNGSGEIALADAAAVTIEETIPLTNFVAGEKYYLRIGARTGNQPNRYNMTEVVTIQF
jgi:hypothetical protein